MLRQIAQVIALMCLLTLFATCAQPATAPATNSPAPTAPSNAGSAWQTLVLATTTSTADSGLLEAILPQFEQRFNAQVKVVAVGTGEALTLGEQGDADVLLVHARAREDAFMEQAFGSERQDVMYNDFVIIGPESDPAGIRGQTDAAAALKQIAQRQALFVSRGDESGTHTKELSLWKAAEVEPAGAWYISAGQGMGAVLTMAAEREAYTLTDRGTYLARKAEGFSFPILVAGDQRLLNPYGVILVNPERHPTVNATLGRQFIEWLTSIETQEAIGAFGQDTLGQSLFTPDSEAWRARQP